MIQQTGVGRDYVPATAQPAVNAIAQLTLEPRAGARIQLGMIVTSYAGGAPVGGRLVVRDGDWNRLDMDIVAQGPNLVPVPDDGITFEAGQPCILFLTAAGAGVTGKISVAYRYVYDR